MRSTEGFAYAQVRLGPARMTHVMRWLGAARRGHEVALRHVAERQAFGARLADLGMIQQLVADNEIDLAATAGPAAAGLLGARPRRARLACRRPSPRRSRPRRSAAIVDRAMQMCGGLGVSDDLPLARLSREVRPFRIYDGRLGGAPLVDRQRAVRAATDASMTELDRRRARPARSCAPAGAGEPVAGPLAPTLLAGGRSNLTYRLDDGDAPLGAAPAAAWAV